jgi:hypothetical protein
MALKNIRLLIVKILFYTCYFVQGGCGCPGELYLASCDLEGSQVASEGSMWHPGIAGGSQMALGVKDGLMGSQMAFGFVSGLVWAQVAWGVIGGLWGL